MQELTLMLIRFAYLAILWIFVLGAISVIRSDMFGARIDTGTSSRREQRRPTKAQKAAKATKPPRGAPTKGVVVDGPPARATVPLDQEIGRSTRLNSSHA